MSEVSSGRVRVAIVNDYELVVQGLARMLAPFSDSIHIIETKAGEPVRSAADVVLYDTFSVTQVDAEDIDDVIANAGVGAVAVYSWNMHTDLITTARDKGVRGYLSKSLTGAQLADAIRRIHAGETVVEPDGDVDKSEHVVWNEGDWPGRREGLSARQAEVVSLICQGMSNEEIAQRVYLSVNTVKSYIRMAYRTMGVDSRTQAVLWGVDHGLSPERGSNSR